MEGGTPDEQALPGHGRLHRILGYSLSREQSSMASLCTGTLPKRTLALISLRIALTASSCRKIGCLYLGRHLQVPGCFVLNPCPDLGLLENSEELFSCFLNPFPEAVNVGTVLILSRYLGTVWTQQTVGKRGTRSPDSFVPKLLILQPSFSSMKHQTTGTMLFLAMAAGLAAQCTK